MIKKLLYIIIFILIISNIFLLIFQLRENNSKLIFSKIESALITNQIDSYSLIGKSVKFVGIEKIFNSGNEDVIGDSPSLLLILDELSCDVCLEEVTKLALEMAKKYGRNKVSAIIKSDNIRYIQGFIRINKIDFDVYFCSDNHFFEINKIIHTPLLIVTNEFNRVIAAHIPIKGNPQYSGPFHFFCADYFSQIN